MTFNQGLSLSGIESRVYLSSRVETIKRTGERMSASPSSSLFTKDVRHKKKRLNVFRGKKKKSSSRSASAPSVTSKKKSVEAFPGVRIHVDASSAFPGIPLRKSILPAPPLHQSPRVHFPNPKPNESSIEGSPQTTSSSTSTSEPLSPVPHPVDTAALSSFQPASSQPAAEKLTSPPVSPNSGYRTRLSVFGLFSSSPAVGRASQDENLGISFESDANPETSSVNFRDSAPLSPSSELPKISSSRSASSSPRLSSSSSSSSFSQSNADENDIPSNSQHREPAAPSAQHLTIPELIRIIIPTVNDLFCLIEVTENQKRVHTKVAQLTSLFKQLSQLVSDRFDVPNYMIYLNSILLGFSSLCLQTTKFSQRAKHFVDL